MKTIKIGTRGSPLGLKQTEMVIHELQKHFETVDSPGIKFQVCPIQTTGDRVQNHRLSDFGGKGLFAKEIETALLSGEVDIAVHSMKDMETHGPDGLIIPAMLERENPQDVFVSRDGVTFDQLPDGAVLGTSSVRRSAIAQHLRPDLKIVLFRGNVPRRLAKIEKGVVDATFFAYAGLKRLDLTNCITECLPFDTFLPCAGQGAIGIQCREADLEIINLLSSINHKETFEAVTLERILLEAIDGTCTTPVGTLANINNDGTIEFQAMVLSKDGKDLWQENMKLNTFDAKEKIAALGAEMKHWLESREED